MLKGLIHKWTIWSTNTDRSENGWESNFPQWDKLITLAFEVLKKENLSKDEINELEMAFELSSEDEQLLDFAKEHFILCKTNLSLLAKSLNPEVRWQTYEVFRIGDNDTDKLLINALHTEKSSYPLRRAILSLCDRDIPDKEVLSEVYLNHLDEYVRKAARELKES